MPTVKELKDMAKKEKIKGYSTMNKADLCQALAAKGIVIENCNGVTKGKGKTKVSPKPKQPAKPRAKKTPKAKAPIKDNEYEKMTVVTLKKLASQYKIPKYSTMKKAELITAITNHTKTKSPQKQSPQKHKSPSPPKNKSPPNKQKKPKSPSPPKNKSPQKQSPQKQKQSPKKSPKRSPTKSPKKQFPKQSPKKKRVVKKKEPEIIENIPVFKTPPTPIKVKKTGDCVQQSHLVPRENQLRVIEHMKHNRGLIAAHGTGTGKTLIMVITAMCFISDPKNNQDDNVKVIFITPVSLQGNIQKEIKNYGHDSNDPRFLFYTMDKFGKDFSGKEKSCAGKMLIIDEAHNLRTAVTAGDTPKTKDEGEIKDTRAKVIINCCMYAEKVLLLTATPIMNYSKDIINLMAMIRGEKAKTLTQFNNIIANENLAKHYFKNYISFFYPERSTDKNYPKVEKQFVNLPMSESYYRAYREVELRELPKYQAKNPFLFYTGLRLATNMLDVPSPKVEWTINKIKEGKRIVIYSAFKAKGIRIIQEEVTKLGLPFVEVTGEMNKAQRNLAVIRYNTKKANIFFITKAGGEGLDLKETQYEVKFESTWNPATDEQIDGRVVRYKSHINLPVEEQKVIMYDLIHTKPALSKRDPNDFNHDSADVILKDIAETKRVKNDQFMNFILPFTIEQYKEQNTQLENKMKTLQNIPFGSNSRHSALTLFNDIMIESYMKSKLSLHTNILKRYDEPHYPSLKRDIKNLYKIDVHYPYTFVDLKEFTESVSGQYRSYFFGDFYNSGLLTEGILYYFVQDVANLVSRFTLGKFEYAGLVKRQDDLYIQWLVVE